jgi:hypothetical protein
MVAMTLSSDTICIPSPFSAREAALIALIAPNALRSMQYLHQTADRIAGHPEVMFHADFGGILDLLIRSTENGR